MSDNYIAAAVQMQSGLDAVANMRSAEHWVTAAANEGARLVALPELFVCYGDHAITVKHAESIDGEIVTRMRGWAKENSIWLVAGSFPERREKDSRVFNTSLVIDPRGQIVARYRKRHLFNIHLTHSIDIRESDHYFAGNSHECVSTLAGVIGMGICFDLRFPEHFRKLSGMGAEVLVVPSAFTKKTGRDHWELLLRARAVENLSYVVAPNLVGAQSPRTCSFGHSCIIDPWGNELGILDREEEGLVLAQIDLDFLHDVRRQLPLRPMC